jgi:hypothetical protein
MTTPEEEHQHHHHQYDDSSESTTDRYERQKNAEDSKQIGGVIVSLILSILELAQGKPEHTIFSYFDPVASRESEVTELLAQMEKTSLQK